MEKEKESDHPSDRELRELARLEVLQLLTEDDKAKAVFLEPQHQHLDDPHTQQLIIHHAGGYIPALLLLKVSFTHTH